MSSSFSSPISCADAAVVIGDFQPFHNGHLAAIELALNSASRCIVIIGSPFQGRTAFHPFTWRERADMICSALTPFMLTRTHVVPVRDYYCQSRWADAVRMAVDSEVGGVGTRTLTVHGPIDRNDYLIEFADWTWQEVQKERLGLEQISVSTLHAIFAEHADVALRMLRGLDSQLPLSTIDFLGKWLLKSSTVQLKAEWRMLCRYWDSWAKAPYPPILFTVDCVVQCQGYVLLIKRAFAPGRGMRGIPGGFIEIHETTRQTAYRELKEETHLEISALDLDSCLVDTALFDRPKRSGRGRTVTHVRYFDLGDRPLPAICADDDAATAEWFPINELATLEEEFIEDNFQMLEHFLKLQLSESAASPNSEHCTPFKQ